MSVSHGGHTFDDDGGQSGYCYVHGGYACDPFEPSPAEPLCGRLYDGVPRDGGARSGALIRCDLPADHAGEHQDHTFDAPSVLLWHSADGWEPADGMLWNAPELRPTADGDPAEDLEQCGCEQSACAHSNARPYACPNAGDGPRMMYVGRICEPCAIVARANGADGYLADRADDLAPIERAAGLTAEDLEPAEPCAWCERAADEHDGTTHAFVRGTADGDAADWDRSSAIESSACDR